jgi:uncharacterized protein (TIGR00730 family)
MERRDETGTPDSYTLPSRDLEFLQRDELRPFRLGLELLKPEMIQTEQGVVSTIAVFGSSRTPEPETARAELERARREAETAPDDAGAQAALRRALKGVEHSTYYEQARELARIVSTACQIDGNCEYVVVTGGGPGIMEAANRGAHDVGAKSVALNIVLPFEQRPNPYVTPELSFQFQYFAIRKMHFLLRAKALVVLPGGFGTLDELFETLTLIQTHRVPRVPVLLLGRPFWERIVDFAALADEGVISHEDLELFEFADSAQDAWRRISEFHAGHDHRPPAEI